MAYSCHFCNFCENGTKTFQYGIVVLQTNSLSPFSPPLPPLAHSLSSLTFPLPKLLLMDYIFFSSAFFFEPNLKQAFLFFLNWSSSDFLLSQVRERAAPSPFLRALLQKIMSDCKAGFRLRSLNYFISVSYFLDDLPNKTWYLFLIFLLLKIPCSQSFHFSFLSNCLLKPSLILELQGTLTAVCREAQLWAFAVLSWDAVLYLAQHWTLYRWSFPCVETDLDPSWRW